MAHGRRQMWNGRFCSPYSLCQAGLIVQLGHDGKACKRPDVQSSLLKVIDTSGIHRVCYALCSCTDNEYMPPFVQLLRAKWWPATIRRPGTVVTFRLLRLYRAVGISGHVNAYDFYNGLIRVTDGAGGHSLKVKLFFHLLAKLC